MSSRHARGEPWDGGPPGADSDYEDPRLTPKYSKNENRSRSQWQGSHHDYGQHPVNEHYNYATKYSNAMYQEEPEPQAAYDYRNVSYQSAQRSVAPALCKSRSRTPKSPETQARRKEAPGKKTSHTKSKRQSSSSSSSSSSDSSSSSHSSNKSSQPGSSSGSDSSNRKRRQKKSTSGSLSTPRHSPSTPPRSPATPARSLSPPTRPSAKSSYRENTSPYKKIDKKYSEENSYKYKDNSPVSKYDYKDKSPSYKYKHSPQRKRREQTPPKRRWENASSRSYKYRQHTPPTREHASRSPERKRYMDNERRERRRNYHRSSSSESERKVERSNSRKSPASKRESAKDVHKSDVDRAKKLAQDCQSHTTNDDEINYESMPSPEFRPMEIVSHAKGQPSNLRNEFDNMKMKTELIVPQPAPSSAAQFKNDGSFLEMFKKMQEAAKSAEPVATALESATDAPVGIKKPTLPFIGKRRGGKVLKTGIVKKAKAIDEQLVDNTPKDAWSLYMQEVKKYRDTSCEEERKTRPLVK